MSKRVKDIEELLDKAYEKLKVLEREKLLTADPSREFQLKEQIAETCAHIEDWRKEKRQLEQEQDEASCLPSGSVPVRLYNPPFAPSFKNSIGMEFVLVPAGKFQMGSDWNQNEQPIHEVTIAAAFYMGKYQVTQGEWTAVMGDNPSWFKGDDRLPVENVSWDDCQEFITRLNARQDGYVYRLPSEAEWEYACRAGTTEDCAGELDAMAWYGENSGGKTHQVGEKTPNAWSLHDMHGNVWEWCQDVWHNDYNGAPQDGMAWETNSDKYRILRGGGAWDGEASLCRSAGRNYYARAYRFNDVGFRLVAVRIF
jgi:formylglycine-generating enzyme required for sulfatase activity